MSMIKNKARECENYGTNGSGSGERFVNGRIIQYDIDSESRPWSTCAKASPLVDFDGSRCQEVEGGSRHLRWNDALHLNGFGYLRSFDV